MLEQHWIFIAAVPLLACPVIAIFCRKIYRYPISIAVCLLLYAMLLDVAKLSDDPVFYTVSWLQLALFLGVAYMNGKFEIKQEN